MSGLEDDFTHKIGPAPVWAYAIGGAALIVMIQRYRASRTPKPATVDTAGSVADPSAEASGLTPSYDASYGSVLANSSYGSAGGQSIPVPLTQQQLGDYLLGLGYTPQEIAAGSTAAPSVPTTHAPVPSSPAPSPTGTVLPASSYTGPSLPGNTMSVGGDFGSQLESFLQNLGPVDPNYSAGYLVNGTLVNIPGQYNTGATAGLLNTVTNPYALQTDREAAFSQLQSMI